MVEKDVCWKMHTAYARLRTREKRKHDEIPCMTNLDVPKIHVCKIYIDSHQLSAIILFIHLINL